MSCCNDHRNHFAPKAFIILAAAAAFAVTDAGARDRSCPAAARAETASYIAEIAASGGYKAGAEGAVKVTVVSKGEYHVNAQYPYKFKAATPAPEGITYPKPVLQRADGTFEATRGTFQVPFVASKAGKATIGGTLHLSVCTASNCIMDKVPLEIVVDVN
jgi:hypothetical protein